jgi:NAD(P)-dependent dehydrogenase (short-subunit alcohol dehydrogenase family)
VRAPTFFLNGFADPAEIEKLRGSMAEEFRVRVAYSSADMSIPEEVRAMVELAHSELDGADILVNNAGIQYTAPVQEFSSLAGTRSSRSTFLLHSIQSVLRFPRCCNGIGDALST